MNISTLTLVEL